MQILLTDTKFVTLPDPMDEMSLPGEQPGPEDKVCSPVPLQSAINHSSDTGLRFRQY